jgi:MoaA/NifB/PqqE/SkfB family radical SAM enzyme
MGLLYTRMKIFHFKEKLDSLPESVDKILAPLQVRIKPTNICNHSCSYCAYRNEKLQLGKDMQVKDFIAREKMLEIIDDLAEIGVKSITFSGGGDPFCYPYLHDSAERLSRTHIKFAALTNGSRLRGKVAEIFAHHATWLRISMDGWDDASYARYRKVPEGEFSKVLDNIENFKKLGGKCHLGVSIVVDQDNSHHLYNLIKELKRIGVDSVKVSPCIVSNEGRDNNLYHEKIFDIVKVQTSRAIKDFGEPCFHIYDSYHVQLETFSKNYHWCPYLQIVPVIGADLNVYPCHDKAYNLDGGLMGSIVNQRFCELWFSDKRRFFKIDPSKHCNHHCVCNSGNLMISEYLNVDKAHKEFV